jgi:hypothetical protein
MNQGSDFLNALKTAFVTLGLLEQIPGGIFLKIAGRSATAPYVVLTETGSGPSWKSDTSTFRTVSLNFAVTAGDMDLAESLAQQVEDAYKTTTYRFNGGFSGPLVETTQTVDQPFGVRDSAGNDLWRATVGFDVQVTRSRGLNG